MEMTMNRGMDLSSIDRIYFLASNFKYINMEKLLSEMFDDMSHSNTAKYLGELNKTDIML